MVENIPQSFEYLPLSLIQRIKYKYSRKITFKAPHDKMTTFFNEWPLCLALIT